LSDIEKIGNIKRMVKMKTNYIRIRLTEVEKSLLVERANKMRMSMSDYVRYATLISPPKEICKGQTEG